MELYFNYLNCPVSSSNKRVYAKCLCSLAHCQPLDVVSDRWRGLQNSIRRNTLFGKLTLINNI